MSMNNAVEPGEGFAGRYLTARACEEEHAVVSIDRAGVQPPTKTGCAVVNWRTSSTMDVLLG